MFNIFECDSYIDAIRQVIEMRKGTEPDFNYSSVAQRIGIQKSYFSAVLGGRAHLSSDQLFQLAKVLNLQKDERTFLLLLLEVSRCQLSERKEELEHQKVRMQKAKLKSESALGRHSITVSDEAIADYFTSPFCSLIHVALTIPQYLRDPESLTRKLGISNDTLRTSLSILERCRVLAIGSKGYTLLSPNIHLSEKSTMSRTHATLFRLKAIEYQQRRGNPEDYFFTASFSATEALRREIQLQLLEFLKWMAPKVETNPPEHVFHLNLDLFRVI